MLQKGQWREVKGRTEEKAGLERGGGRRGASQNLEIQSTKVEKDASKNNNNLDIDLLSVEG